MGKTIELLVPLGLNLVVCILAALLVRAFRNPGRVPRLNSPAEAVRLFLGHFPDVRGSAALALDGSAALLALEDGRVGLLQRHGHRWNARILTSDQVRTVACLRDGSVTLRLRDYTGPAVVLPPGAAPASELWSSCLRRLLPPGAHPDMKVPGHA